MMHRSDLQEDGVSQQKSMGGDGRTVSEAGDEIEMEVKIELKLRKK